MKINKKPTIARYTETLASLFALAAERMLMDTATIKHWLIAAAAIIIYSFVCGMLDGFN